MIKLVNVNKYYQSGNERIHVIKDLNYEFPNTGLVFILGPSGSGKSTLLNLLGGLDKPDSGEIWIEDKELGTFTKKEQNYYLNSYLGFVFQEYNILKDLNLKQNINLSLQLQKRNKKESKRKVNEIINEVELNGLEKRKVSQLSGGQKQRIAIARALVKDPSLIIADEPTGNLDSETSKKIFDLFKKISKQRLIIIVTHDEESANLYGDSILKIDTANQDFDKETSKSNQISSDIKVISDRKLYLEKAKTPFKTIFKLAFKNIWTKKLRYLLMFVISLISLVFLSFAIELNGDKLYQNVFTTVNNDINYTDIYQYIPKNSSDTSSDFYAKFEKSPLMNDAYTIIKRISNDLTLHKYQTVNINYSSYNIEKSNYLYQGRINTIILFDNTNDYRLLAGKLPNSEEPEILITDYLLDAFKHFGIVDSKTNIYTIINKYFDFGYTTHFKVVGVVETNYKKWIHLSRYKTDYEFDEYDESIEGFEYDYLMMNSFIVGKKYYDYLLSTDFNKTEIYLDGYNLSHTKIVSPDEHDDDKIKKLYNEYTGRTEYLGNEPQNNNEIVVPYSLINTIFNFSSSYSWETENFVRNIINNEAELTLEFKYDSLETENDKYNKAVTKVFKVVGFTITDRFILTEDSFSDIQEAVGKASSVVDNEKVIVELSNNPNTVLNQFNKLYNNDYHFIIDVFKFKDSIESYDVDPMIKFASTGGLIVFSILTIGIMWTIISIEIVDSKKEIGILRSIGLSGNKVSLIFIIQTLFVNILSYLASIPIAYYVIDLFGSNIMDGLGEIHLSMYTLTYRSPLILAIFILIITLFSTILPLIKIMRRKIIDVINERDN